MEEIGEPPAGYESLDGFPGVFISTRIDSLGHIIDLRDQSKCPCLRNLSQWSSAEIQSTCIAAYEAQMVALEEAGGGGEVQKLQRALKAELREVGMIYAV
ncbi:hypothetical protein B484DRAFT_410248 [Ochromonadaceae sp. CCMP2298]|nr:hypothetical protein B484DRAFT_410248 [Ochromonadaceae sp. CCMP2298]